MRRAPFKVTVFVVVLSTFFSSCATILGHSSYPVSINSNPSGATINITDKKGKEIFKGQSPATVELKSGAGFFSKAEYQVKITSPGYAEQIVPVNYRLNGWYFGNLIIGGALGMLIIDPITGAMWKLSTPPINIKLNKSNKSTTSTETPILKIIDIANVPEDMRSKLIRVK
ncbi:MAG: PEGA domain-containing protein [Sphingobacteriia bacterium]|nr:PEGA domain-containing protein [Sphingobacteriia bacterium]